MKHFEEFTKNIAYVKSMYELYGDWLKDHLGNDVMFFNLFLELGFENAYSYYSVVCHERYIKSIGAKRCFVFRNGSGPYHFEFDDESKLITVIKSLGEDVLVTQKDALTIFLPYVSKSLIRKINDSYFQ